MHADDLLAARHLLNTTLEQPGATATTVLRLRRSEHFWRHFEIVATNLLDDAAVAGVVVTCHDVTERREFEQQLTAFTFQETLTELPNPSLMLVPAARAGVAAVAAMIVSQYERALGACEPVCRRSTPFPWPGVTLRSQGATTRMTLVTARA